MMIPFALNKNNQNVVEEQAVWRGTDHCQAFSNQFESFSNLRDSTVP